MKGLLLLPITLRMKICSVRWTPSDLVLKINLSVAYEIEKRFTILENQRNFFMGSKNGKDNLVINCIGFLG